MNTLAQRLARYVASVDYSSLSSQVVHEVKRRMLDSLACAYGAYDSKPARIARSLAEMAMPPRGSTLIGAGTKTTPDLATFANGTLFRYLDYNDTYLSKEPAHPSDNVPAALAVAEFRKSHGKALIIAIVLGYEIHCRLCDAASLRARGWDHVSYVSIAVAVLASKLLGLDEEKTTHAIALAINPNITLRQTRVGELSMWKGCAAANASRNGVFATLLAKEGMTGPTPIFEGEKGFFNQVTGPFELSPENFGGEKSDFKILETYIKYYPSEYHSQAAVEAALELRKEVHWEEIEKISVQTYDACVDIIAGEEEKWRPETRETADHSLPYCIAVALMDGKVGLEQFDEERIHDPTLRNLIQKVTVVRNPEHTKQYPEAFPCLIEIETKGGRTFSKMVTYPKGHPRSPLTDQEIENKFTGLSLGLLSLERQREISDAVWRLEDFDDVGEFMKLLSVK